MKSASTETDTLLNHRTSAGKFDRLDAMADGNLPMTPLPSDIADQAAYCAAGVAEYRASLRATSLGSPSSFTPILLVTYAYPISACGSA